MKTILFYVFVILVSSCFGQKSTFERSYTVDSIQEFGDGYMIFVFDSIQNKSRRLFSASVGNRDIIFDTVRIVSGQKYLFVLDSSNFTANYSWGKIVRICVGKTILWEKGDGSIQDSPIIVYNAIGQYILNDSDFERIRELGLRIAKFREEEIRLMNGNFRERMYYRFLWKQQKEFKELDKYIDRESTRNKTYN